MKYFEDLGKYHFYKKQANAHAGVIQSAMEGLKAVIQAGEMDYRKLNLNCAINLLAIAEKELPKLKVTVALANEAARLCAETPLTKD
jgi:hypothetical protein